MTTDPFRAYRRNDHAAADPRRIEGRAFAMAAQKLQDAASRTELRDALSYNLRLWTTVQAAVTDPANTLPADIKAKLLSLSMYIDKRVSAIMAAEQRADVSALVEINRTIAMAQFSEAA